MFNHVFKTSFEPTFTSSEEDTSHNHLHCHPSSFKPTNHSAEELSSHSHDKSLSNLKIKDYQPSESSSLHSPCNQEEDHSFCNKKEILGPAKTPDLPNHKTILKKTSALNNSFSSSCLGYSSWSKSKVIAPKHFKSSSSDRPSTSTLANSDDRDQSLYSFNTVVLILIVLLLFYSVMIKLLHLPFDRGKELSSKHLS